ncbi:hypothetical protein ABT117_04280 [Streptomyces sp. NPDC002262]|uniref:hypothetical protein n=1 Tax=Streptomyces sp. NPDC002262 TaxID=3154414 RepID=UPI003331C877
MGLLSWLRGGRGTERPAGTPAPTGPPVSRADRFDVTELPPLQRVLQEPALVIGPSSFERGLTTRRPTALSTPLGHLVSAEAPSGLVRGVTTPVQRSVVEFPVRTSGGPPAPGSPEAAVAGGRLPAGVHDTGTPAPGGATPPESVQRTAAGPVVTAPAPRPSAPEAVRPAEAARVQRAAETPRVPSAPESADAVGTGAGESGTVAADDAAGAVGPGDVEAESGPSVRPLVGEQPLLDVPDSGAAGPATAGEGDGGEGDGGSVPPVQRSLTPPPSPSPSPAPAPFSFPPPPPAPRRAPGLGAPLPSLPPTAQREASGTAPAPAPASAPVQPESTPPPVPSPAPALASAPVPEPVAPLLADRPLVLRTVDPGTAPPAAGPPPEPAVVPVRWESRREAPAGPPPALSVPAVQRRIHVPEAPAPASRAPARPAGRSAPAGPYAPRDAGDVAVAAGVAQRMADGSVVFAPPPPPAHRPSSPVPFVQREVATEEPPPPDAPPADAPDPLPGPEPEPEGGAAGPGGAASTTAAVPPGAAPGTPPVTDEFVRALYPSLARLLKAELRLERERAGRLIDTRF